MASRNQKALNKVKRIFKEIGKSISEFFKGLWNKFQTLPTKVKAIGGLWLVIIIVIIILISTTSSNKNILKTYQGYEKLINEATLKYIEANQYYGTRDQKIKVDLEELKDEKLITDSNIPDNTCKGYSLAYYDDSTEEYKAVSYINCKKYTSKDYYDYKS